MSQHISDDCLERYYLGMVRDETELAPLEEHLLWCQACVARAEQAQDFVDWQRVLLLDAEDAKGTEKVRMAAKRGDL